MIKPKWHPPQTPAERAHELAWAAAVRASPEIGRAYVRLRGLPRSIAELVARFG